GTMSWHGGCIYMKYGTVRNTTCQNGNCTYANNRSGGNIYMENGTLANVTLLNGTSGGAGGNLYMNTGAASGLVCENGRAGDDGGNVRASNATISDSSFSGGTIVTDAEKKGANIYVNGTSKLIRCHLSGGTSFKADGVTAGYDGGSVCSWDASIILEDCLVEGSSCGGVLLGTTCNLYGTTIVNNNKYGIWSWKALQVFQNCVIFGNYNGDPATAREYAGNQPSGDGSAFLNCAMASGTLSTTTYPSLVTISSSDFADYANGDYRPAADGALVDAGAADERADASMTDLDGNPRLSDLVDIGCYEYQHTDMTVSFTVPALDVGYAPATATFTASAENAPGEVSYDVNFGDGTLATYTTSEISHVYTSSGSYTISVTAVSGVERSKPMTRTVKIVDKIQRVGEGGHSTIQAALDEAVAGCEVILAAGIYEVSSPIVVNKAVTVSGEGSVVVRNTAEATAGSTNHRVMEISGGALVTGLVIENGSVFNGYGGCLDVSAATVSNCVIRGGTATRGETGNVGGAGVSLRSNAVLTHCYVTNNVVTGTSTGSGDSAGGAIFIHNGNKPVRILNTLVAGNRYVCTEGAAAKSGAAGILFGGGNENSLVENCTIVANTVEGALSNDSAGLHCTSWSARFRNNVIAGNFETAKGESGKYTSAKIDTTNCTVVNCVTDDAEPLKANSNCSVSTVDEMFKNFAKGDYSPKPKGALFDVGTTPSVSAAVDLTGKPRVMFAGIDVGCFECQRKLGFAVVIR
ncbi:MAG: PKD domain-containing protein, partial [Kiritimatiellae bacterium]|nr:PKD domain-containing protein [Kiritimatiellia bacterium]